MLGLAFVPCESLAERPHVMVDGAALASSVLTLSHWPQSPTPSVLARDVSAASVLAYLRLVTGGRSAISGLPGARSRREARSALDRARSAEAVTNDHFDEDGLMSVFGLVNPETALGSAALIEAVATCGDFGVAGDDIAAGVCFAIEPLADEEAGADSGGSARYEATLPRVAELLEHPARFERYFAAELAKLAAGRAALDRGDVVITERHDLDLAIVERQRRPDAAGGRLPGAAGGVPVHRSVVHSATTASRVIAFDGGWCECYLRYEGWVKTVSRRVPLRPDLAPLAAQLSAEERSGVTWECDGVGAVVAGLRPGGEGLSEIGPSRIVRMVSDYLAFAEPAWDPFRPGIAYIPESERRSYKASRGPS